MIRSLLIILIILIACPMLYAQDIKIKASNESLGNVLKQLNVQISFDSKAVSKYQISLNQKFASPEDALSYLLKGKPFVWKKMGDVYVISPQVENQQHISENNEKMNVISGVIADQLSGEPLPYAYIKNTAGTIVSNESGQFSIVNKNNNSVNVKLEYLGYSALDTTLNTGFHKLYLSPQSLLMQEVIILPKVSSMILQTGKSAGEIRVNPSISKYMPGSSDNAVFNLLRMMPGVRASGEPSVDLIVRGSENGESKITFDGFTVFGVKSFSDNICFINPYMVKDIRLNKGSFDATLGNRIGAIAEVTGIKGDSNKPALKATVSNLTANIFGSVPITKRSNLLLAYRQTYYNLYDVEKLDPFHKSNNQHNQSNNTVQKLNYSPDAGNGHGNGTGSGQNKNKVSELYIYPDYAFRDINLKYAGSTSDKDNYHLSVYTSKDDFDFSVTNSNGDRTDAIQNNRQIAGSAFYNRMWDNTMSTKLIVSYSKLKSQHDQLIQIKGNQPLPELQSSILNQIKESDIKLEHSFKIRATNNLQIGAEYTKYECEIVDSLVQEQVATAYVNDNILLGRFILNVGIRGNYLEGRRWYIQPRLNAAYQISDHWNTTVSWGLYNQFVSRSPYLRNDILEYVWSIQDKDVISSRQYTIGTAYSKNNFLASLELYYKKNKNIRHFLNQNIYLADVTIDGIDFFLKKEFSKVSTFGSYSLTKISRNSIDETGQEVKIGTVVSSLPVKFSANYVYGWGFSGLLGESHGMGHNSDMSEISKPYSRLDIGAVYEKRIHKVVLQAGVSVINTLGNQNLKYSYRQTNNKNKDITTIYTKAAPFTPMLFLEIVF